VQYVIVLYYYLLPFSRSL